MQNSFIPPTPPPPSKRFMWNIQFFIWISTKWPKYTLRNEIVIAAALCMCAYAKWNWKTQLRFVDRSSEGGVHRVQFKFSMSIKSFWITNSSRPADSWHALYELWRVIVCVSYRIWLSKFACYSHEESIFCTRTVCIWLVLSWIIKIRAIFHVVFVLFRLFTHTFIRRIDNSVGNTKHSFLLLTH